MQFNNSDYLFAYVAFLRAAYHWFHAAHHVTRGAGFMGDHVLLYSELYNDYLELLDVAIEKTITITNEENAAAPVQSLKTAIEILSKYQSPETTTALGIAGIALQIEKDYVNVVEELFSMLEAQGSLSLGFNDFLSATANKHEGFIYKLQQRVKSEVQD